MCYDQQTATPHPVTPPDQRIIDYAFAPDGNWLAYRAGSSLALISTSGSQPGVVIDPQADPPVDVAPLTLAWSPDGAAIAYITADGLRLAFPPTEHPRMANMTDRAYRALRFSPDGSRLAVQVDDGGWNLFAVDVDHASIKRTRTIDQASEIAWLDDNTLLVAALSGGLIRINAEGNDPPAWTVESDHFTQLFSAPSGQVMATHPDPGDTIGTAVSISLDGNVTPLGSAQIDARIHWGPDGRTMLYITSGTPILVNPATGAEDMLPIRNVTQVTWSPPPPRLVTSLTLDGDLYFLGSDGDGVKQLWRLVASGEEVATQVTRQPYNIIDFAVSPDRSHAAVTRGGQIVVTSLDDPTQNMLIAKINDTLLGGQPAWRPDGQQIVYRDKDGLYLADFRSAATPDETASKPPVFLKGNFRAPQFSADGKSLLALQADGAGNWQKIVIDLANAHITPAVDAVPSSLHSIGWSPGPEVVQLYRAQADGSLQPQGLPGVVPGARLSPTGRFAAGIWQSGTIRQLLIFNLQTGQKVRIVGVDDVSSIAWVS